MSKHTNFKWLREEKEYMHFKKVLINFRKKVTVVLFLLSGIVVDFGKKKST